MPEKKPISLETSDLHHPRRLLIADASLKKFSSAIGAWKADSAIVDTVDSLTDALKGLSTQAYDLCIVNMSLNNYRSELITELKQRSKNERLKIVAVSKKVERRYIEEAVRAGADDFVAEPFEYEDIHNRILYHLMPKTVVGGIGFYETTQAVPGRPYIKLLLDSVEVLSRADRKTAHTAMVTVLQKTASLLESNRTSLIVQGESPNEGIVLASSDDPTFTDYPISLSDYPEVSHVVNTGTIVLVDDVERNILTHKIKDSVKSISIGSLMVFPVRFHGGVTGCFVVRRQSASELPAREILSVIQSLANILASHAHIKMLLRKIYSRFDKAS